jgi:imidazolonepropionase-like amidohydrolase
MLIRDCTLIDGTGAEPRRHLDLEVESGRIARLGPSGSLGSGSGGEELDASGCWVVPGLFNCHDHLYSRQLRYAQPGRGISALRKELDANSDPALIGIMAANAAQELYQGVTTSRDLGCRNHLNIVLRDAIRLGRLPGPRVLACGMPIAMTGGHVWTFCREADGVDECRKATREQLKAGADVIKIMASGGLSHFPDEDPDAVELSAEEMAAIVEEAHNHGKLTCAHAYATKAIRNCLKAGVDNIDHGVFLDEETVAQMAAQGATYVPMLTASIQLSDPEVNRLAGMPDRADLLKKLVLGPHQESFRMAARAGLTIGVASDSPGDVIQEMAAMVELCYSTMQALQAATGTAARICGVEDRWGALEEGKLADLMVVEADPLESVGNLERVRFVVKEGVVVREGERLVGRPKERP